MQNRTSTRRLRAGAAQIEITPPIGTQLAGSLLGVASTSVQDPLYVRAIVLDNGEAQAVFILLDLIAITNKDAEHARRLVGEAIKVLPESICLSCTHTHNGPAMTDAFNTPRNREYIEWLLPRIVEVAVQAASRLRNALAGWAIGHEDRAAFNRRFHMRDGTVRMNPGIRNPDALRPAGPTDPQLPALLLKTPEGEPLAALANFSLHYIGDNAPGSISADYFGQFSAEMQRRHGAEFMALLTHGFSGDINAIDTRGSEKLPYQVKSRRLAKRIADEIDRFWNETEFHSEIFIGSTSATLTAKVRKIDEERAMADRERAVNNSLSEKERIYARERLALLEWPDEFLMQVQALRIGDFAAVTTSAQMFCRFGLDLKYASPFPVTATIEHANGCGGYVATRADYVLGSYETELARSSFAMPGTGENIVALGTQLLRELAQEHPISPKKYF